MKNCKASKKSNGSKTEQSQNQCLRQLRRCSKSSPFIFRHLLPNLSPWERQHINEEHQSWKYKYHIIPVISLQNKTKVHSSIRIDKNKEEDEELNRNMSSMISPIQRIGLTMDNGDQISPHSCHKHGNGSFERGEIFYRSCST